MRPRAGDQHNAHPELPGYRPAHAYPPSGPGRADRAVRVDPEVPTALPDPLCPMPGAPAWVPDTIRCLADEIARAIELRQVTSRGATVRPPATCTQPVGGRDVDDQVIGVPIATSDARLVLLKRVVPDGFALVVKGVNWGFVMDAATPNPVDPAHQLAVSILVNGQPAGAQAQGADLPTAGVRSVAPYVTQHTPPAPGGVQVLGAAQIYAPSGTTIELVVDRLTPPSGQTAIAFLAEARWKGWQWIPTIEAPGALGAGGF